MGKWFSKLTNDAINISSALTASITICSFLISKMVNSDIITKDTLWSSSNGNITCAPADTTCTVFCTSTSGDTMASCGDTDKNAQLAKGPEISCPVNTSCTECNIYCLTKRACWGSTIYGNDCDILNITIEQKDNDYIAIYAPKNGSLFINVIGGGKIKNSNIHGNSDTNDIIIDCSSGEVSSNDVYATNIRGILSFKNSGSCKAKTNNFYCPLVNDCIMYFSGGDSTSNVITAALGTHTMNFTCISGASCTGTTLECDYGTGDCVITCTGECVNPPTPEPTSQPTVHPTIYPSLQPTIYPSLQPTVQPTVSPTVYPSSNPSFAPSTITVIPSSDPTNTPTNPTIYPSSTPTNPTLHPSKDPTINPSRPPSVNPTNIPSISPTTDPTNIPSTHPTFYPSNQPITPTSAPTNIPSNQPIVPSYDPTNNPSVFPTTEPTVYPTTIPSNNPSIEPFYNPTYYPTYLPNINPSDNPTYMPTSNPNTVSPTSNPNTISPTFNPNTFAPTWNPTIFPTSSPSTSSKPTKSPDTPGSGFSANTGDDAGLTIIIIATILSLVFVCCLIFAFIFYRKRKKRKTHTSIIPMKMAELNSSAQKNKHSNNNEVNSNSLGYNCAPTKPQSASDNDVALNMNYTQMAQVHNGAYQQQQQMHGPMVGSFTGNQTLANNPYNNMTGSYQQNPMMMNNMINMSANYPPNAMLNNMTVPPPPFNEEANLIRRGTSGGDINGETDPSSYAKPPALHGRIESTNNDESESEDDENTDETASSSTSNDANEGSDDANDMVDDDFDDDDEDDDDDASLLDGINITQGGDDIPPPPVDDLENDAEVIGIAGDDEYTAGGKLDINLDEDGVEMEDENEMLPTKRPVINNDSSDSDSSGSGSGSGSGSDSSGSGSESGSGSGSSESSSGDEEDDDYDDDDDDVLLDADGLRQSTLGAVSQEEKDDKFGEIMQDEAVVGAIMMDDILDEMIDENNNASGTEYDTSATVTLQ